MKLKSGRSLIAAASLLVGPAFSKDAAVDARLMGTWNLDVAKSQFAPEGGPKSGVVSWTEHGWVVALVFDGGYIYADAVITDYGCAMIGVPAKLSCKYEVITPTHVRFTLLEGKTVRRLGDIELVDADTTKTVHVVTPATGAPYSETTIWTRQK